MSDATAAETDQMSFGVQQPTKAFEGESAGAGEDDFIAKIHPKSWLGVLGYLVGFVVLLVSLSVPWGIAYERFDVRAFSCYDSDTYFKFPLEVTEPLDWCIVFSYPYRLVDPDFLANFLPAFLYFVHQFGQWIIIWQAQNARARGEVGWDPAITHPNEPSNKPVDYRPNTYAKRMFALNISLVLFKFIQSHISYDGLANNVPEISALYSVAIWLFFAMAVQMPKRGLFLGYWKSFPEACELGNGMIAFLRKNHGYAISFGTTYNFWYHPVEGSPGFILGYLYQFAMILQSGFLFHPFHRNKFWTLLLEMAVIPHSIFIALFIANGNPSSAFMFGGGFSMIFITTYMHGFDLSFLQKLGITVLYFGGWIAVYLVAGRELSNMRELLYIGSSFTFVPAGWLIWCLGTAIMYPFRSFNQKNPWTTGFLWFLIWLAQIVLFFVMGPNGGRGGAGGPSVAA